jgi:hypothetical protein
MKDLKLEKIALADLVFDPANARQHDDKNLAAIAGSLKAFGQRKPIVVTADNVIVAGNGTAQAAQSLGWDSLAVVRVPSDWSDAQIKAFALADNKTAELAEWDFETLGLQAVELSEAFDLTEFGFSDVELGVFTVTEVEPPQLADGDKSEFEQITFTLHESQAAIIREAIAAAKLTDTIESTVNDNSNANAITLIAEKYLNG